VFRFDALAGRMPVACKAGIFSPRRPGFWDSEGCALVVQTVERQTAAAKASGVNKAPAAHNMNRTAGICITGCGRSNYILYL